MEQNKPPLEADCLVSPWWGLSWASVPVDHGVDAPGCAACLAGRRCEEALRHLGGRGLFLAMCHFQTFGVRLRR